MLNGKGQLSDRRVALFLRNDEKRRLSDREKLEQLNKDSEGLLSVEGQREVIVGFRDPGPIVSQTTALNIAYAGPLAMTLLFFFCSE